MNRSKASSVIMLTLLLIGMLILTFNIQPVKAEGNKLLLTSSTCITDGTNDWIGGTGLDYMDITSACIVNIDCWTVRFEMTVASDIPEDPSPKYIGYVWYLDLDKDGIFNEFPPYAVGYTDLNVRVAFDPDPAHGAFFGWHGFIDGKYGPQIVYESFSIIANTVSFTLSLSSIYDPTSFLWQASTVGSVGGAGLPHDIAPNYGLPRASWIYPPSYTLTIYSSPTGVMFTVDGVSHTTPWSGTYSEGSSVSLVMPETHDGSVWSHWLEDGDTNRIKTITLPGTTYTAVYTTAPVGGTTIAIESSYLSSWIASILLIISLVVTSGLCLKRKRSAKE